MSKRLTISISDELATRLNEELPIIKDRGLKFNISQYAAKGIAKGLCECLSATETPQEKMELTEEEMLLILYAIERQCHFRPVDKTDKSSSGLWESISDLRLKKQAAGLKKLGMRIVAKMREKES